MTEQDLITRDIGAFRPSDEHVVADTSELTEGALAAASVIAAAGAMVVLGEPGAGKTSLLAERSKDLPELLEGWDGRTDRCLWVSGADLTELSYDVELGNHLAALPPEEDSSAESGVLTVVLDQADESAMLKHLPRKLAKSLLGRDTRRVRFLLACRTADYPVAITSVLLKAFGACYCVDLAPLSREEAVQLADSAGVSGEDLIARVEQASATVLASIPLTLEMLVRTFRADGVLPSTPEALFARGVELLAEDPDPTRVHGPIETTAAQRLAVAGRIAAWTLLSGHRTVWRGRGLEAGHFDLPGADLVGGTETTTAGVFDVTAKVLRETLATALFTGPDENRVAVRHSSVAAYLTARYLVDRETSAPQLVNLLMVGSPDGESASIPVPLRETASWIVAMRPSSTHWLAAADPESLAVHSALVRSDEVRRLTVEKLLERAARIELGDTQWSLARWDLHHPQLAEQLAEVLEGVSATGTQNWDTTARVRIAVRLARDATPADPRLVAALLTLTAENAWHPAERRLAAQAAYELDPECSAPALIEVLESLNSNADEPVDREHFLRGALLTLLWPDHIDLTTMLTSLRNPPTSLYGVNAVFWTFLRAVPDEQVGDVLAWTLSAVCQSASTETKFVFTDDYEGNYLLDAVFDRALGAPEAETHLDVLAQIATCLFQQDRDAPLPPSLQPDATGGEPQRIRDLRRMLAQALVEEAHTKLTARQAAWMIVRAWTADSTIRWSTPPDHPVRRQLLGTEDFAWAMSRVVDAASTSREAIIEIYGELASFLFARQDESAMTLASNEQHPAWPYLRRFVQQQPDLVERVQPRRTPSTEQDQPRWSQPEFLTDLNRLLDEARAGNNDRVWLFVSRLRIDPQTGRWDSPSGPMRTWPAAAAIDDSLSDLTDLALRYLTAENDHADDWLGEQDILDWRSWAGYSLLTELDNDHRLGELPESAWTLWAASVLKEFVGASTSFDEPSRIRLLRLTATHAPTVLAQRMTQIVAAAHRHHRHPYELKTIDFGWNTKLLRAGEQLLIQLSAAIGVAPESALSLLLDHPNRQEFDPVHDQDGTENALATWHLFLTRLLAAGSEVALAVADGALAVRGSESIQGRAAVLAAEVLLAVDAKAWWPRIKIMVNDDSQFGLALSAACVRTETERTISKALDETELVEIYLWLGNIYIPEEDNISSEAHFVTDEEEARRWRDRTLQDLGERATAESIRCLRALSQQYPNRLAILGALVAATKQYTLAGWSRSTADDVIEALKNPTQRVIRVGADLLAVVEEALEKIGQELVSHCELLWDRTPGIRRRKNNTGTDDGQGAPDRWRPKPEAALCAYLAHELTLRLGGHRVAVNREVLILPTDPYGAGDRTDILIDAHTQTIDPTDAGQHIKLVIEVKGAWNADVETAQETQLVSRYLPEAHTDIGIYLVGWYPIDLWDATGDKRKTKAKKLDPATLSDDLNAQAQQWVQASALHIRSMVMNIPRPTRTDDTAAAVNR
ncbi:NACHT domain-containing protein [Nocardia takedensis]|uniref:NACHT domain-containing protein n=1 Tax=Nocardia takedensis TaxID=259390 RepID=UPI003F776308